ncbi:MAG TPA: LamG domain-containing protein [Bacillota bacterium]|nr:LamG domain-containing protein [Bacillota bacterium]
MEGKPSDPRIWYSPDGQRIYNQDGELVGHLGHYETLGDQLAAFTRASVAYTSTGQRVASGVPRYEYIPLPAPVWQDTFDTDQLSQYTSGGNTPATWAVSGGVLMGTGGSQATLIKNDLLLQDCDIVVNSDQAEQGGIIARYQDNNNYYLIRLGDDSSALASTNITLFKRVAGTFTQLAVADVAWSRGTSATIKFTLHGTRLEVYFNSIKVISITDTTFTGGGVGLRKSTSDTAFRVLDFAAYYVAQGVMSEEANANLVRTNAGADPLFNSSTGWTLTNATIANGVLTLQSPDGVAVAMASCTLTNLAQNTKHSFLIRARYKDTTGTANTLYLDLQGSGYDNAEQELGISTNQLTTAFQNFKKDGFDSQSAPASVQLRIFTFSTRPIEVEFVQLEQKNYATSIMDGSRAAEVPTAPVAGVFQKGNWTVELEFTPTSSQVVSGRYGFLWEVYIDSSNYYRLIIVPTGQVYVDVRSGGVSKSIADSTVLVAGQPYSFMISGNGSVIRFCKNGAQIGSDLAYTEPAGNLPTNMYIGSANWGSQQANGLISDLRVSSRARTLAEHQAEYNSGLPLQVDEHTTYLMSCDGTLQPTVRDFGLFTKNGRIVLQDPQKGQGLEVWDGTTRKVLIGKLDDGTIGQEIVGGELYSSRIRSGGKTDTSYIQLSPGFEPLLVKENGKDALSIWASGGGLVQFFDTNLDDMVGQITNFNDLIGQGLRIQGRDLSGNRKSIHIWGNYLYLEADSSTIDYHANLGHYFFGDLRMGSGTKYNIEETVNYGKRLLAVRESPEQKYVDEGKAQLVNGECRVAIDPIFLECIEPNTDDTPWLIHLTPYADIGIYVAEIGTDYFIVKERNGGTSNSVFAWSLSATRKNHAFDRLREVI